MDLNQEVTLLSHTYALYREKFPSRAKSLRTAIVRYLLPYSGFGLNFQVEPHKSLSREQAAIGLLLTEKVKLEDLSDIPKVLSWQEEVFKKLEVDSNIRSVYKCYLNIFLQWCKEHGWLKPKKIEVWTIPVCVTESRKRHGRGGKTKYRITNRHQILPYKPHLHQLSLSLQERMVEYKAFWTDPHYAFRPISKLLEENTYQQRCRFMLRFLGWLALDKLDYYQRMCEYAWLQKEEDPEYNSDWLVVDLEPPLWLKDMAQKYPPRRLDELRFEDLVPVVDIRSSQLVAPTTDEMSFNSQKSQQNNVAQQLIDKIFAELEAQNATLSPQLAIQLGQALQQNQNFANDVKKLNQFTASLAAKEKAQADAQEAAKAVSELLNDYIKWLKYQHNPTNRPDGYHISTSHIIHVYSAVMNLAKFLYKDITNSDMSPDYRDISVIMKLRAMRNDAEQLPIKSNPTNPVKRNPTWNELGQLLKILLEECSPRHNPKPDQYSPNKELGRIRTQNGVARDFQRYLIIMFFRLISPDRQHVVRQLRLHDTLKLCSLNWSTGECEEAPWDVKNKRYHAYYNSHTKLYYLDPFDAKDLLGNVVEQPLGKAFEWVVFLDATQTKIDKENAYRVPKICNPELQAWLYGREDYSGVWQNWPPLKKSGEKSRYRIKHFNWCGYVDAENNQLLGFRDIFKPNHDFVFTQNNGTPFTPKGLYSLYDNIMWTHLGFRANVHGVRSAATSHYKRKGITDAQSRSLARIKSHSQEMQDSSAYTKLNALEETELASRMIIEEFLLEQGLDPDDYGLV